MTASPFAPPPQDDVAPREHAHSGSRVRWSAWLRVCLELGFKTCPVPFLALVGLLLDGPDPVRHGCGLLLAAAGTLLLSQWALRSEGLVAERPAVVRTAVLLALTAALATWGLEQREGADLVLLLLAGLVLPHVGVTSLAWPGWWGLLVRAAVGAVLFGPAVSFGASVGFSALPFLNVGMVLLVVVFVHTFVLAAALCAARPRAVFHA